MQSIKINKDLESLKKYAKHDDVKKDLFLVIPSNTLHVINHASICMLEVDNPGLLSFIVLI